MQQLRDAVPCPPDELFHRDGGLLRGARLVAREEGRSLYVSHTEQVFWAYGDPHLIRRIECLEGRRAANTLETYTWALPQAVLETLRSALTPGAALEATLSDLRGLRAHLLTRRRRADGAAERDYLLIQALPPRRAILHVAIDAAGAVIHHEIHSGRDGSRRYDALAAKAARKRR